MKTTNNTFKRTNSLQPKIKGLLAIATAVLLCGALLTGCSKDGGGDPEPGVNQISYNGHIYSLSGAEQHLYGDYYGSNANNIDLYVGGEDLAMMFGMFVSTSNTKLVAGTYTFAETGSASTFAFGGTLDDDYDIEYEISSGTVTVAVSGSTYTIDINCKLSNGKTIKGNYTGTVSWTDERSGSGTTYPGNLTLQRSSGNQSYSFGQGTQSRMPVTGGIMYMLNFLQVNGTSFTVGFMTTNTSSTTLPTGTYPTAVGIGNTFGISTASLTVSGSSLVWNSSTTGNITVAKSGNTYTLTFNYQTNGTPTATITGTYVGELPTL